MVGSKQSLEAARRLTERELRVLMVLAAGPRHGYGVMKEITESSGGRDRIGAGSLYPILERFVARGLIEEYSTTAVSVESKGNDRKRRYFCLTEVGRGVAADEVERLESLAGQARRAGLGGPVGDEERYERRGEKSHLLGLDEEPVHAGAPDASERLDSYVYGSS